MDVEQSVRLSVGKERKWVEDEHHQIKTSHVAGLCMDCVLAFM